MDADGFQNFAIYMGRANQPAFNSIAEDISTRFPNGARILDLGAAAGEPSLTIATKCANVTIVSTDIASENLVLGAARASALGLTDKVTFATADASDLSQWEDNSFDAVVGSLFLQAVSQQARACHEIHRVLKPSGAFITTVPQENSKVDTFAKGMMPLLQQLRAERKIPNPPECLKPLLRKLGAPIPIDPANLAGSAPDGKLGDMLRNAGFSDVTGREFVYSNFIPGLSVRDCAKRFISATPLLGLLKGRGGNALVDHGVDILARVYEDASFQMVDIEENIPEWAISFRPAGKDNPDNPEGLTLALKFPHVAVLYVTAQNTDAVLYVTAQNTDAGGAGKSSCCIQ